MSKFRIGFGYDVHPLVADRDLIVGGHKIPFEKGLMGHSDADVLLHAIADALMGALAMGDIGKHFPDTDPEWHNADSVKLLARVTALVKEKGYEVNNLDTTLIAEKPKFSSHIPGMQKKIAETLNTSVENISIKATTNEKLGWIGRGEGIAAMAHVMLIQSESA